MVESKNKGVSLKQSHGQKSPLHVDFQEQLSNLTLFVAITDKPDSH